MVEVAGMKPQVSVKKDWALQTQSVQKIKGPLTIQAVFHAAQTSRPMLARVAESMYWMSRYIERAEHVARIVWVNFNVLMDLGELAQNMQAKQWQGVMRILRLHNSSEAAEILNQGDRNIGQRVSEFMTFDQRNRHSLINCLTKARENARSIRESISAEMWETLNTLYWSLLADDAKQKLEESPGQIFEALMHGSLLFQGVTDQTLPHGQGWQFIQLAKSLERVEMTCHVIDGKFDLFKSPGSVPEIPLSNVQLMAILRSCSSLEAFRRRYVGELDAQRIATFLISDKESPRSIRYCVKEAQDAAAGIAMAVHPLEVDPLERILGRLNGQLEYSETKEFSGVPLRHTLDQILENTGEAASAIHKILFLH